MKNNLKRLQVLLTLLNIDIFYSIGVSEYNLTLQGFFKSESVKVILKNKFKQLPISEHGYMEFERDDIKITLT